MIKSFKNLPEFSNVINSIGWLLFEKVFRLVVGFYVFILIAKHLGPEDFGLLNFVTALTDIFLYFSPLGLNMIVVKKFLGLRNSHDLILGSSFLAHFLGAIIFYTAAIISIYLLRPEDQVSQFLVIIAGMTIVIRSTDIIRYWFESNIQSKYIASASITSFGIFSIIKVALVLNNAGIELIIWSIVLEQLLIALILIYISRHKGIFNQKIKAKFFFIKELLSESWPFMISAAAMLIFLKVDQIMLGEILNDRAVGIYSAAVRLTEILHFLPIIIMNSFFPLLFKTNEIDRDSIVGQFQEVLIFLIRLGLILIIPMSFFSEEIIFLFYGEEFLEASKILSIHLWTAFFVFFNIVFSKWHLIENTQIFHMEKAVVGATLNILLNLILISLYGVIGAAIATLISLFLIEFFYDLVRGKKQIFYLKMKALKNSLLIL